MIGFPIILSSQFMISGGTLAPSNPAGLYCPYQRAMLVEEFRFAFDDVGPHKVSLKAGRALITEGQQPWTSITPVLESGVHGYDNVGGPKSASNWKLSRPLYLPVQRQIAVTMKNNSASGLLARALFGIRGRVLPEDYKPPATVEVPWVGVFRPAQVDYRTASTTDPYKSVGEFKNQFKDTLHITKFIGSSSSETLAAYNDNEYGNNDCVQVGVGRSLPQIKIFDGRGNPVVRDATTLLHLCQGIRNEWLIDFDMAPGELLQATMDLRHPMLTDNGFYSWPSIAMVGWREVPYSEIYG